MRNYFIVGLRNLRRERLYAAINIAGLSLGIACCLVLALYLRSELTYDRHYPNHENIYRVVNEFAIKGNDDRFAITSRPLGPMLKADYPEVRDFVRFENNANQGGTALRHGDDVRYWENSYFVSPNVFDVFPPKVIYGDPKTALKAGGSIAISETVARHYFGNANPIGETFTTDGGVAQKITLVFADQPANTHLKYDLLFSDQLGFLNDSDNLTQRRNRLWGVGDFTYVVMDPSFKPADWERINDEFYERNMSAIGKQLGGTWHSWLQPLADIHLNSDLNADRPVGNRIYLYGFAAVAVFILAVACINYMNLATARATRRARSVGIRKILGASRGALATQFLGEAVLYALLALVLGVVIVELALTFTPLNTLMGGQVRLDLLHEPALAAWLVALAVAVGVLSGLYPALYLSAWAPLAALTGKHEAGRRNNRLREGLVLLQFTISAAVIACTLLMIAQMRYVASRSLGFEKENRVVVSLRGADTVEKIDTIRSELGKDAHVLGVASADTLMGRTLPINVMQVENAEGALDTTTLSHMPVDVDFVKVMGLNVLAGRDFSQRLLTDAGVSMLVNESLVKKMGWAEPIGKRIQLGNRAGRVIGVVQDFNFKSLHFAVEPFMLWPLSDDLSQVMPINRPFIQRLLVLNISGDDVSGTLARVQALIQRVDPRHPFEYSFLDEDLDKLYKSEHELTKLIAIFATVCIFIAALGLFGLAAFTTEQRTREIGTRKVLGASTLQIIMMLSRRILVLVGIASVLAAVIAYFAMDEWLADFAYRAAINPFVFVISAAVAAAIGFATVALQSYKTASADPVKSLRHV